MTSEELTRSHAEERESRRKSWADDWSHAGKKVVENQYAETLDDSLCNAAPLSVAPARALNVVQASMLTLFSPAGAKQEV